MSRDQTAHRLMGFDFARRDLHLPGQFGFRHFDPQVPIDTTVKLGPELLRVSCKPPYSVQSIRPEVEALAWAAN